VKEQQGKTWLIHVAFDVVGNPKLWNIEEGVAGIRSHKHFMWKG
jgi:hypothetical protein